MSYKMSIFSGDKSEELWNKIDKLNNRSGINTELICDIFYLFGCKCQELESEIKRLKIIKKPSRIKNKKDYL